ncbi:toxin-antitoxin system, antitoxin component, ArsR family [Roseibium sp. TrichSKD4]|uniref:ArsR/SmtB family transcription factor n=1 Tax=Roseibium sp. TrichSKD4 TaxID=744980 RepID=UPI0001E57466|nr:metalloregulator ArsR/SmtB family transcription factor [Roseibium sp. TrichSKD4]EFO29276.1 toxin-antitoxin system, antitoxin component, ArsR family [Roseibium sp. TrichSKD4]
MEIIGYEDTSANLDAVFAALSDPTRRAILTRLAQGEATVNELAEPFQISQPAISKHLKVLEKSGLIERGINRTKRPARLKAGPMADAVAWLEEFRKFWSGSFDQLDALLEDLQQGQEKTKGEDTKT